MPISVRTLRINLFLFCAFLGGICLSSLADDFDNARNQTSSTLNAASLSDQEEFLPVTEAYKLSGNLSRTNTGNHLRLTWLIAPNYYLYQERFKFHPTPEVALTPTFSQGTFKFDEFAGKNMTVFHNQAAIDFDLPQNQGSFDLAVTSQGCAEAGLCYPPYTQTLHIDTTATTVTPIANAAVAPTTNPSTTDTQPLLVPTNGLWQALILALAGGIILNLMPCVFPVLSIKVLSLVQADGARLRHHGWAYTLGIVLCFVAFASLLLIAKRGGEAIGWGFQLQSPMLVIMLTYLFFTMGLSMSGLIQFGTGWMGAGQQLTQQSGLSGSFFTGVLAAVVASPCTAPFMGAALGYALTQPAYISLAIFAALGLGMALPLLALCYLPHLAHRLPKPGMWMERLKEVLAFPLYLSAIWLLWVLSNQAGTNVMATVAIGGVAISFACWLHRQHLQNPWLSKTLITSALAIAFIWPYASLHKHTESSRWQAYSPELLAELRQQGHPVFIDLTADWCLTCLANERVTLSKSEVEAAFDQYKVATLKGDWTNRDPNISKLLQEYGRSGVPLYLWFPAHRTGKADVLPQLLTPGVVLEHIKSLK